ncbi:MAG: tetratricopeptide repeat protein, partial [Chloroflexi bacterium]|nr:tetratricopeptide repeat protein [Chloroflexota bacterium]
MRGEPGSFAELLRAFRTAAGLTQEELAARAGLSGRGVQDLERGLRRRPHVDTVRRVAAALDLEETQRAAFLAAAAGTAVSNAAPAVKPPPLPVALTSFIGRERELAEARRLLATARLLTLTGAGGVGKTRLALQLARSVAGVFQDGVWLVDLAPLTDPTLVPQAVASMLGVREQPTRSLSQTLAEVLRSRSLLLVLHNCEHLVSACAELAETLLRACPDVRILATSREVLRIGGETTWRVPPLGLPPLSAIGAGSADDRPSAAMVQAVEGSEAVQLFVERAAAGVPGFTLSQHNMLTVARICQQLDGLALAIELAAARVSALGMTQLAARIADRFRVLTAGSRTALPQHRTLRATVEWSYALLDEAERRLFERLAVFAGGWTLEAAEAVGAGDGIDSADVMDLLARLVDKSLVVVQESPTGDVRYRLLETMREYGWECLVKSGAAEPTRRRHALFHLALAERAKPELTGAQPAMWLRQLDHEHDNIRTALHWAIEVGESELGLRLTGAVWRFWFVRGHEREGRRWLEEMLALAEVDGRAGTWTRADVLSGAAALARDQGDYHRAAELAETGLALFREIGDKGGSGWALQHLGCTARDQADYVRAARLLNESVLLFRECGDCRGAAWALHNLARVAREQGDCTAASRLSEESLALFRSRGDKRGIAFVLHHQGCIARDLGDYARAAMLSEESLALCRALGDDGGSA